jgi:hypothetical protein
MPAEEKRSFDAEKNGLEQELKVSEWEQVKMSLCMPRRH